MHSFFESPLKQLTAMAIISVVILTVVSMLYTDTTVYDVIAYAIVGWLIFNVITKLITGNFHRSSSSTLIQAKVILINFFSSIVYPFVLLATFFLLKLGFDAHIDIYLISISLVSLFWLLFFYKRQRLIQDTVSTRLNSAAQGYSQLEGQAHLYDDEVVRGPHMELPIMLWYRSFLYTSSAGFILNDNKGRCTIDPRNAEIYTPKYSHRGSYSAIYPNETIYVLGQLNTLSKQRNEYETNNLALKKMQEWKSNKYNFLHYFDKDKNGKIDASELATAKEAASRFVDLALEETYQNPATHVISEPDDGRPYIISSIHPEKLIVRYKRALVFHLASWVTLSIYVLAMQVH